MGAKQLQKVIAGRPTESATKATVLFAQRVAKVGWVDILIGGVVFVYTAVMLFILCNNICSPVCDPMTGFHMDYYRQFAHGGHSYYRPSFGYTSDGYTPLASQVFGWVIRFFGYDIRPVRAVAALVGLSTIGLAARLVWHLSRNGFLTAVSCGLTAGIGGLWFMDVGPNGMHALLGLLGVYLLVVNPNLPWTTLVAAAFAFFGCFWAKQTGLAYIGVFVTYAFTRNWAKGLVAMSICCLLAIVCAYPYLADSNADFIYWIFRFNMDQPLVWNRLWSPVLNPLIASQLAVLVAFVIAALCVECRQWRSFWQPKYLFLFCAWFTGVVASLKYGSGMVQLLLAEILLIVFAMSGVNLLIGKQRICWAVARWLILLQLVGLAWDVRPMFITKDDESRWTYMRELLSAPNRTVHHIPGHPYLVAKANKVPFRVTLRGDCWDRKVRVTSKFDAVRMFYATNVFDMVLVEDTPEDNAFPFYEVMNKLYAPVAEIPAVTGALGSSWIRSRKVLFVPKSRAGEYARGDGRSGK